MINTRFIEAIKNNYTKNREFFDDYDKAEIEYTRFTKLIQQEEDKYSNRNTFNDSNYDIWKTKED